jgi:hypothetical protein
VINIESMEAGRPPYVRRNSRKMPLTLNLKVAKGESRPKSLDIETSSAILFKQYGRKLTSNHIRRNPATNSLASK